MKALLEFTDDDIADRRLDQCLHAVNAFIKLLDIDSTCRGWLKYGIDKTKEECLEDIREMIQEDGLLDCV